MARRWRWWAPVVAARAQRWHCCSVSTTHSLAPLVQLSYDLQFIHLRHKLTNVCRRYAAKFTNIVRIAVLFINSQAFTLISDPITISELLFIVGTVWDIHVKDVIITNIYTCSCFVLHNSHTLTKL